MLLAFAFGIDKDVTKVHYHKNMELLCQNFIDIALECGRYVGQSKKYHLFLDMAITGPESRLPFIAFLDPHLMVGICQIELGKRSGPT